MFQGDISEELTMTKSILISLAVLTLSTSAALAAHRTHHRHAMNAYAGVDASPVVWTGGVSSSDRGMYTRNLHDSRYNPKKQFRRERDPEVAIASGLVVHLPSSSSVGPRDDAALMILRRYGT
jgi:hypothetical protein